eukprot:scaffold191290_cov39-Tisochrysis_lutea.AAC.3
MTVGRIRTQRTSTIKRCMQGAERIRHTSIRAVIARRRNVHSDGVHGKRIASCSPQRVASSSASWSSDARVALHVTSDCARMNARRRHAQSQAGSMVEAREEEID